METNNKTQELNQCPMCPNHCPTDALKCGKGRNYFALPEGSRPDPDEIREKGGRERRGRNHAGHHHSGRH